MRFHYRFKGGLTKITKILIMLLEKVLSSDQETSANYLKELKKVGVKPKY